MNMSNKRNYGIDLLRILAMFMVVNLHVLGHGGVLGGVQLGSVRYMVAWFLEASTLCAVNVYALISGYVGGTSKFRFSRLLGLWLQVVFYTVLITFFYTIKNPEQITLSMWKNALFPICTKQYWYITGYFGLYLMLPFIRCIIDKITLKDAKIWGIILLVFFSIFPSVLQTDPFNIANGYSMLWLCTLYIVGACIKKYNFLSKWSHQRVVLLYCISVIFSWGSKLVLANFIPKNDEKSYEMMLMQYISPTIILASIALLVLFARINFENKILIRLVTIISPATLGVYIIHEQFFIKTNIITGISLPYAKAENTIIMLFQII